MQSMGKNKRLTDLVSCFMILQLHSKLCCWDQLLTWGVWWAHGLLCCLGHSHLISDLKLLTIYFSSCVFLWTNRYQIRTWNYYLHAEVVCFGMEWSCTNLRSYLDDILLASCPCMSFQERVCCHLCSLAGFGTSTKNSNGYFGMKNFEE